MFRCPLVDCPCHTKEWSSKETLHVHINGHLGGKFKGTIPQECLDALGRAVCTTCKRNFSARRTMADDKTCKTCFNTAKGA